MKRLVIIGANDFQNQLILKAKQLGYETYVFAWKSGAPGETSADYFYPISIVEKDIILKLCEWIRPDGICSIASDLAMLTVNYVAEKLHLTGNSMICTQVSTNKYLMRKALEKQHLLVPKYHICTENFCISEISNFKMPCIVKPTDRSGSRAITKITDYSQAPEAVRIAIEESFEKKALVEEYIEGDEYSCECISQNGEHHFLAFTRKYTTGAPNFIETGHLQPSGINEDRYQSIILTIFNALNALEIKNGASHSEFKMDENGEVHIIEIGGRMGGDCIGSDLVQLSTGYDYLKMVIDVACGNDIDFTKRASYDIAAIKFIFDEEDIDLLDEIKATIPEVLYRVSEIEYENMGKTKDSSTRLGYFILLAKEDKEKMQLKKILRPIR